MLYEVITEMEQVRRRAEDAAEDRILDILLPPARDIGFAVGAETTKPEGGAARQRFRKQLREGLLDDQEIEVELSAPRITSYNVCYTKLLRTYRHGQGQWRRSRAGDRQAHSRSAWQCHKRAERAQRRHHVQLLAAGCGRLAFLTYPRHAGMAVTET